MDMGWTFWFYVGLHNLKITWIDKRVALTSILSSFGRLFFRGLLNFLLFFQSYFLKANADFLSRNVDELKDISIQQYEYEEL